MSDNTPTVIIEDVATPSKFAVLKSKITREGLILGGIAAGAIIAGVHVLLKAQTIEEIEAEDPTEDGTFVITDVSETPES